MSCFHAYYVRMHWKNKLFFWNWKSIQCEVALWSLIIWSKSTTTTMVPSMKMKTWRVSGEIASFCCFKPMNGFETCFVFNNFEVLCQIETDCLYLWLFQGTLGEDVLSHVRHLNYESPVTKINGKTSYNLLGIVINMGFKHGFSCIKVCQVPSPDSCLIAIVA